MPATAVGTARMARPTSELPHHLVLTVRAEQEKRLERRREHLPQDVDPLVCADHVIMDVAEVRPHRLVDEGYLEALQRRLLCYRASGTDCS